MKRPYKPFRPRLLSRKGKPFATMLALEPPPPLELALHEQAILADIRRSGPGGLCLGGRIPVSSALRLALIGAIFITREDPQRLVAIEAITLQAAA